MFSSSFMFKKMFSKMITIKRILDIDISSFIVFMRKRDYVPTASQKPNAINKKPTIIIRGREVIPKVRLQLRKYTMYVLYAS